MGWVPLQPVARRPCLRTGQRFPGDTCGKRAVVRPGLDSTERRGPGRPHQLCNISADFPLLRLTDLYAPGIMLHIHPVSCVILTLPEV